MNYKNEFGKLNLVYMHVSHIFVYIFLDFIFFKMVVAAILNLGKASAKNFGEFSILNSEYLSATFLKISAF